MKVQVKYKKLSNAMKKAHKEGRHPGWAHINLNKERKSYPEKFIFDVFTNNKIFEKYTVVEKLPVNKYFLDFAIIDLKLDIEIDGEQHYRNEDSIKHDKIRNEFLLTKGWKIYRINWKEFNKKKKENINKLLDYIDNIHNKESFYYKISDVIIKQQPKYGNREKYFNAVKQSNKLKQQKYIKQILNSQIDFSKFGWVKKVAKIINQKPQKVNKWMKRFLPEFYEKKCFKRQSTIKKNNS
ncbi:MAG: hypothetical protein JETCAE03_35790 [Ignavibacteriaceae bacterium]|jgi:very-short-patch-repair endonuclease|nr:MAG: hypothetical protein JETCAE03_35790 [Ignavibacteriaceae bacterium]